MQRKLFSKDSKEILELINALVDGRVQVMLQGKSGPGLRTSIVKIHYHQQQPYLLIAKPQRMQDSTAVKELLFKMSGLPVLGFSCPITREADNLLAAQFPKTVFQLELREHERFNPLQGSMATFFTRGGARVSICMMDDICMGGAKLTGAFAHRLQIKDVVGPCTLSLAGRDALISREVTVNRAEVVRVEEDDGASSELKGVGIKFDLQDYEERQLKEHLDFLINQK